MAVLKDGCPFSALHHVFLEQQRCCNVDIMTDGPYKAGAHCSAAKEPSRHLSEFLQGARRQSADRN